MPKGEAAATAAVKTGELVLLDYELWSEGGAEPELIDTTRAAVADKAGHKSASGVTFAPRAHLLGGEYFPASVEAAIVAAKVGEEVTQTFPPAEAFGEKDPKLIELFSMHEIERLPEMRREDAELNIGTILTIKGRRGRVSSLTAARVRVDFNPPFAGGPFGPRSRSSLRSPRPPRRPGGSSTSSTGAARTSTSRSTTTS